MSFGHGVLAKEVTSCIVFISAADKKGNNSGLFFLYSIETYHFDCSLQPSRADGSNGRSQCLFSWRDIKISLIYPSYPILSGALLLLFYIGSCCLVALLKQRPHTSRLLTVALLKLQLIKVLRKKCTLSIN